MNYNHIHTFFSICSRDLRTFRKQIKSRFIDSCIWSSVILFVNQYIMPQFGVPESFGSFLMIGNMAVWGLLEVNTNVATLIGDLQGDRSISYYLTLPIPQTWVFIRIALVDACKSMISALPLLPVGKLVLWNHVSLSKIAYGTFFISYIIINIFFGFFGLFLSSITKDLTALTTVKTRIIFPLWFLGGYQFTWHMFYNASPVLACINLLNPITYVMSGIRASVVTDQELLPFPLCMFMLLCYTILFGYLGIKQFKKELDCL